MGGFAGALRACAKRVAVALLASAATLGVPASAVALWWIGQRRKARRELQDALAAATSASTAGAAARAAEALALASRRAEDALGSSALVVEEGLAAARRKRAEARLLDAEALLSRCAGADSVGRSAQEDGAESKHLDAISALASACSEALAQQVDPGTVARCRAAAQQAARSRLADAAASEPVEPDPGRLLRASEVAELAGLGADATAEARATARSLALARLHEALAAAAAPGRGGRGGAAAAAAQDAAARLARACEVAEAAGASARELAEGRAFARRLRAEATLRSALGSGAGGGRQGCAVDALEATIYAAEGACVAEELLAEGRATAHRWRAEAALAEAVGGARAGALEAAVARAERAGADAAALAQARAELVRLQAAAGARRERAAADLRAAMAEELDGDACDGDAQRLYLVCRSAEEAGVDETAVARGRAEARRRFDFNEMRHAAESGDLRRALLATGGPGALGLAPALER